MKSKQKLIVVFSIFAIVVLIFLDKQMTKDMMEKSKFMSINDLKGVTMIPIESSITTNGLTLLLTNNSELSYYYGSAYTIEKFINNQWYKVPYIINSPISTYV